jgi:hypothetical protein
MPVVSSPLPLFAKPLLYTTLGMVSCTIVQQGDEVHQDSSVMYGDTLAELECSLCITPLSVCCK